MPRAHDELFLGSPSPRFPWDGSTIRLLTLGFAVARHHRPLGDGSWFAGVSLTVESRSKLCKRV